MYVLKLIDKNSEHWFNDDISYFCTKRSVYNKLELYIN